MCDKNLLDAMKSMTANYPWLVSFCIGDETKQIQLAGASAQDVVDYVRMEYTGSYIFCVSKIDDNWT